MEVRIYKPSKNAMQSGLGRTRHWVLEYERPSRQGPEPLMGWTSSEDTLNQVRLKFDTRESAVAYAQGKGWSYTLSPERCRNRRPRNYVDNFRYIPPETGGKQDK